MKIYEMSVRKPISTILILVGVLVFGGYSLTRLSVDLYPDIEIPYLTVITAYPGASAADIEQNVSRVLENNLNSVSNMKRLVSSSRENTSIVALEFEWGTNLDEASNEIRDVIGRIESQFPDGVQTPMILKFSSSMMPVMYLYATAEESYGGIYKLLDERVVNSLNRIDGVGAVNISGAPEREIQVNVDPKRLEAFRITIEQIGQVIAQENLAIPAGAMDIGSERLAIRTQAEFNYVSEINDLVVVNFGGREIRVRDVAHVSDTIRTMTVRETLNGQRSVMMIIQKQSGANTVDIANAINAMLPELRATLPPDVELGVLFDTSTFITNSINSLTETVMYAFLFVILVILFFLGRWRATIIICLTIPVSLITAFIYLMFSGGTLNIISLSSLSIALVLVVDDAIVILENITKHLERKARPKDAAIYGTNEVWLAVIATTLTLLAVFLPLTMVGGMAGILFQPLGWIIAIVTTVSTVAAVTLTPMLAAYMMKYKNAHTYKGLGIVFKPIDAFLDKLDHGYARLLNWVVNHKLITLLSTGGIFVVSILLFSMVPQDFMPAQDQGQVEVSIDLPVNYNLEQTVAFAERLEARFMELIPEIKYLAVSSGASDQGGFAALFGNTGVNGVSYTMILKDRKDRNRTQQQLEDVVRAEVDLYPEVTTYTVGASMGGMMGSGTVDIKIFGFDFDETTAIAKEIQAKMREVPGAREVNISREDMRTEMRVEFDREKLARFGINTATAATFVRNRINGLTASVFREDGEEYNIVVRYDEEFRGSVDDILNIRLMNNQGATIMLREVATIVEDFIPPVIQREDRQRVVTVSVALGDGVPLGTIANAAREVIRETVTPAGVTVVLSGSVEDQENAFRDMGLLLVLVLLLVYIVMATQFESFSQPLIIMISVLFAFTGVFLALWITNTPLSLIALIGAIMLVGIVVKNGIIIVDFTNLQRERGLPINEAVITAGKSRLRPVLMTSLTTIFGMMPLAIGAGEGSEMWQPMGIAIIGGMTFSTLLTLLVVPTVYATFNIGRAKKERKDNMIEIE
ncbi:MAG: efflux RND transporter permease subunit [Dysgonamonadaceae bacterium]|jgi:HAE1 family hydrophobic/amphiphilic exporter-1|nr:efflux RND transporter permease subunit [Dysgonamonadaceae bacterium]